MFESLGWDLLKLLLIIGIADVLLLLETDIGATLIISLTAMAMLYAAGSYIKQLTIVTVGLLVILGFVITLIPNRVARFLSFWNGDIWNSDDSKTLSNKSSFNRYCQG